MDRCFRCGAFYFLTLDSGKLLVESLMEQEIKFLKGLCLRAGIIDKNNNVVWEALPEEGEL